MISYEIHHQKTGETRIRVRSRGKHGNFERRRRRRQEFVQNSFTDDERGSSDSERSEYR